MPKRQKIYAYVDESGQDESSKFFVVVAVVSAKNLENIRKELDDAEREAKTYKLKWHKTRHDRRMSFLSTVLRKKIAAGDVYIAHYKKPLPYFYQMLFVLEKAIKATAKGEYIANVYVDGIDQQKAKELTNALRMSGISLRIVKSRRDESEVLIRLADMWAGCIRSALLHHKDAQEMFRRTKQERYLNDLTT